MRHAITAFPWRARRRSQQATPAPTARRRPTDRSSPEYGLTCWLAAVSSRRSFPETFCAGQFSWVHYLASCAMANAHLPAATAVPSPPGSSQRCSFRASHPPPPLYEQSQKVFEQQTAGSGGMNRMLTRIVYREYDTP